MSKAQRTSALAPFRIRSYRFQWTADLATSWAFEMEMIILGWYILVETGSVTLLTVYASLQFLGTLFAPMFGLIGDRIGHRNLLCVLRAFYALLSTTLMTFAFTGVLTPVHVFISASLCGRVRPSDLVMRHTLVGATMPGELLMGAMSISRTTQDSARSAGALAGATLVSFLGIGPAYVAIAIFYAVSFTLTLGVTGGGRPPPAPRADGKAAERVSPWRDLAIAAAYIWNTPYVLASMCLALLVNLTAFPLLSSLLPYVAKEVYHVDQTALGYLVASLSLGALCGSISLSNTSGLFRPARTMIASCVVWHLLILGFAQLSYAPFGAGALFVTGFVQSLVMVPMSVVLLRSSDPAFRGRVMGLRMLVVYSLPVGLLISGPLIEATGFRVTASLYCLVGLAFTVAIGLYWRSHLWNRESPANARS